MVLQWIVITLAPKQLSTTLVFGDPSGRARPPGRPPGGCYSIDDCLIASLTPFLLDDLFLKPNYGPSFFVSIIFGFNCKDVVSPALSDDRHAPPGHCSL